MDIFVDTNVLVYYTVPTSPFHTFAVARLADLYVSGDRPCISTQVIREYWHTVSLRHNLSSRTIADNVNEFRGLFTVLDDGLWVSNTWQMLVERYDVMNRSVYDCNIVATMVGHGVGELLTHNVKDFQRYVSDRLISVRRLV